MLVLTIILVSLAVLSLGVGMSGLMSTIFVVVAVLIFLVALVVWLRGNAESPSVSNSPPRIGYVGRKGSKGDLSRATFGEELDQGIDNAGEVDASEADFR